MESNSPTIESRLGDINSKKILALALQYRSPTLSDTKKKKKNIP